jgi:hypothetical protein
MSSEEDAKNAALQGEIASLFKDSKGKGREKRHLHKSNVPSRSKPQRPKQSS